MNAHRLASWPYLLGGLLAAAAGPTCSLNPQPEPPGATADNAPQYNGTGGAAGSAVTQPVSDAGAAVVADAGAGPGGSTGAGGAMAQGGAAGQGGAPASDAAADAPADTEPAADAPAESAPDAEAVEASDDGG